MHRSVGKQSGESVESVRKKKRWEGFAEKGGFKPGNERGVTDDESGESMEPMKELPPN